MKSHFFYLRLRVSNLLLLVMFLTLISCQGHQKEAKTQEINPKDTSHNIAKILPKKTKIQAVKGEIIKEPEDIQSDTLTIYDRMIAGGKFRSHIKLDFAKINDPIEDSSQIRVIDTVCAISILPDSNWINREQKKYGDSWNEIVSDNQYYEFMATDTLEKLRISTFYKARNKRFIQFVKYDSSTITLDVTKMKDAWGLILFNREDNPVLWSSTDINDELKTIYKK